MKKIKLFALAAFAMLSMNVMAAEEATDTYTYTVSGTTATITGFVNGLTAAQMETVTIPATIVANSTTTYTVVGVDGAAGLSTTFKGNKNIKKVVIEENASFTKIVAKSFEECSSLTEIDLSKAPGLVTLGANALAGTSIKTLDLSKTKVRVLNEFNDAALAATYAGAGKYTEAALVMQNITLTTVILNDTWTDINADAFKNCTALKTVNFQTANPAWIEFDAGAAQQITAGAFVNTAIENLDLSGTILTTLQAKTFNKLTSGGDIDENTALKTVKLNKTINSLKANFSFCTSLTSIDIQNDPALTTLTAKEFQFDAKLTSIDLSKVTALATNAFEGTGLKTVTFNKNITTIPASCFQDCSALATIAFASDYGTLTSIETLAFGGDVKLDKIKFPAIKDAASAIAAKAFFMCKGLKEAEYKPTAAHTKKVIDADAFLNCNDKAAANLIVIYTNSNFSTPYAGTAPTCTKFSEDGGSVTPVGGLVWEKAEYKKTSGKYYVKVQTPAAKAIKVKASSKTKVYGAYLDNTAKTLYMQPYMVDGGYYTIGVTGSPENALIVTTDADIAYENATASATSTTYPLAKLATPVPNVMQIAPSATSVTTILSTAASGYVIYGWANSDSKGTGWLNITSGTIPAKGLYVLAKPTSASARLNVVWLDEDGNVDEELTAIHNVKTAKAENGAIYNLAGQKVNASYKGVVIKDGKKYIQK